MEDYLWQQGDRTIAKYVEADDIKVNTVARLTNDEACGYEEDGVYVGTYSSVSPNLKPKSGILSKLLRKDTPQRNHLFVNIGPHKLIMKINSKWSSREEANILAIITATTPADHMHKLFDIGRKTPKGIITASELISEVELDIRAKFESYVLDLNSPKDFETKDDLVRIENGLRQIAEDEFSKIGVIVQSVSINYGDSEEDRLIDLKSKVNITMETGMYERQISSEERLAKTAEKQGLLTDSIENMSHQIVQEEYSEYVAEDHARESAEASQRELTRRTNEIERESISHEKIRDEKRKILEQKMILERLSSLKSNLPVDKEGVESDEE